MLDTELKTQNPETKGTEISHFCTYFDQQFLLKGLALYRSLLRHSRPFKLYVLCLDNATFEFFNRSNLPHILAISLQEFESGDEDLLEAKKNRSQIEYYFTCTSSFLIYILGRFPKIDLITYLDADLFFYSQLTPMFEELADSSVLIVPHKFPDNLKHQEKYGIYNVGLLCFRNDKYGRECLQWWRDRCLEWCYDRVENGLFADQKYLDDWPIRFSKVVVLQHQGAGLAPWNVDSFTIKFRSGLVYIESQSLIFFHFHRLRIINPFYFIPLDRSEGTKISSILRRDIYGPYLKELQSLMFQFKLKSDGLIRHSREYSFFNMVRILVFGYSLFCLGPLTIQIHLEFFIRPILFIRNLCRNIFRKCKKQNQKVVPLV